MYLGTWISTLPTAPLVEQGAKDIKFIVTGATQTDGDEYMNNTELLWIQM